MPKRFNMSVSGDTYVCEYDYEERVLQAEYETIDARSGMPEVVQRTIRPDQLRSTLDQQLWANAREIIGEDSDEVPADNDEPITVKQKTPAAVDESLKKKAVISYPHRLERDSPTTVTSESLIAVQRFAIAQLQQMLGLVNPSEAILAVCQSIVDHCEEVHTAWKT